MACAAAKKQGTISEGFYFDDDFFLWKYTFTFSDHSAVIKFLEITSEGKSIHDAADSAGVEIECDADEKVVKAKSYGDRKATVITISEKLPCVEDWYKIAKSYDGKADVTCRALAEETGEKYFNYRYIGDGNKGQPVLVQGNVKESKEMEEEGKELVDINNLKVEKDYIDDNGKIFDIYYDEGDESPRKMYDNGATIVILRGKYESPDEITDELEEIADEHDISLSKDCDLNALISALQEAGYYAVPVYILDHGNVHYSTHDFGDKWDSGMAGVAYAKKSGADEKKLQKMIDAELAEYETWANGNVYGISVRGEDGEVVDGEGGFYLSDNMTWEDMIKEMLDAVEVKIQDKYERFHGFEDDEDDYEDDEEPIEESRKPKDKRVYAEIYSYGIPSHITWFDNLKTAKRELENHIASMTKVGDYEIFRDEKAADVKMQEGDFEITLYVSSGSEDVVDNDVEHVIIRPKKEPVKEEINKTKMNEEIKKWRSIKNELASRKIAFLELDSEDLCDYGNDTPHAITLNVDDDTLDDEDLVFALRKIGKSYIIQYGEDLLESDEDRDVSAKEMVDFVEREIKKTNESLNDTNSSTSKTDVTPVMNKIKVIGNPVDKSDFLFYCSEIIGEGGNPIVFWVHEGTGDNLDDEQEEQGFNDYIYYTIYEGVKYSTIDKFIYGDYDVLEQFEGDSDFVYLYNNYRDLTVQQICWKILKNYGEHVPEKLTVRILEGNTAADDFKMDAQKYTTGPITKKLVCYINYVDSNNDWWPIKAENIKTKSEAIEYLIKKYGKDCKDTFHITVLENKYRNGKVVHSEEIDNDRGTIAELSSRIKKSAQNESLIGDESHNIELSADKAAKFIKESVEWLLQEEMGCCTKELTPEVQLAVGWLNGYDPEDTTLIHSKEDPTWCICVGIVAADGDDLKTDLEWLTIPYVADGENEGDVFSELMEPLSPNDNYAKVFKYLAKEYEGILKEYDVHSDGKCFHKKGNAAMEESIKTNKRKGGLTCRERYRASQRGFKYSSDMDTLIYEDDDIVIASDEDHIPSWDVLDSGDYELYGREVTDDDIYLDDDGNPIMMSSILYDGPWEKFTIRDHRVVGREPTDEQPA